MLKPGEIAQDFRLPYLNGETVSLSELLSDGPVLLAFFKVSCPVCQYTFPFLDRIETSRLRVIGISQDDEIATQDFRNAFGVRLPMLLDSDAKGYPVSNSFGITHVPSLFLVDSDGRIAMAFSGFSRQELEEVGSRFGAPIFAADERTPAFKPG